MRAAGRISRFLVGTHDGYPNAGQRVARVRVGEGVVLVVNTLLGRLQGGGEPLRLHNAYILRYEDGLVVRRTAYTDIDEARAAAERLAQERGKRSRR